MVSVHSLSALALLALGHLATAKVVTEDLTPVVTTVTITNTKYYCPCDSTTDGSKATSYDPSSYTTKTPLSYYNSTYTTTPSASPTTYTFPGAANYTCSDLSAVDADKLSTISSLCSSLSTVVPSTTTSESIMKGNDIALT